MRSVCQRTPCHCRRWRMFTHPSATEARQMKLHVDWGPVPYVLGHESVHRFHECGLNEHELVAAQRVVTVL